MQKEERKVLFIYSFLFVCSTEVSRVPTLCQALWLGLELGYKQDDTFPALKSVESDTEWGWGLKWGLNIIPCKMDWH